MVESNSLIIDEKVLAKLMDISKRVFREHPSFNIQRITLLALAELLAQKGFVVPYQVKF